MLNAVKSASGGKLNRQFILMLGCLMLLIAGSSNADEKIKLRLHQPPPNKLGAGELWKLDITNTTNRDTVIYLTGSATEEKDGLIVSGVSKVFTVKPGKTTYGYNDFKNGEVSWNDKSYEEGILRTGNVKSGRYIICVTAFYKNGSVADNESCITQVIDNKSIGMITITTPSDGEEIDPDTLPGLMFSWKGIGTDGPYELIIVEIRGEQSEDIAIKENRPFFEQKGIKGNSFQYPVTGPKFEAGKKYALMVSSGDVESEIYTINIKKNNIGNITLLYPYDNGEVGTDTLTFKWNRNDPCPPHVICKYTLRIVELRGEQSPDEAIKENESIFVKTGITETSFQYRFRIEGHIGKIAWQVTSDDGKLKSEVRVIHLPANVRPWPTFVIELIQKNTTIAKTMTDSSGNFTLKNIPDGEYGLKISNPTGETPEKFLMTFGGFSTIVCCCPGPPCEDPLVIFVGSITENKNKALFFKNNEIKAKLCPCKDCCPPPMNVNEKINITK